MVRKGIDDCSFFKVRAAGPSKFMREKTNFVSVFYLIYN